MHFCFFFSFFFFKATKVKIVVKIAPWKGYIFYWFHYKLLVDIGLFFTLLFVVTNFMIKKFAYGNAVVNNEVVAFILML